MFPLLAVLLQIAAVQAEPRTCIVGAAAPAAATCSSLLFFDSGEAELSRDATAILEQTLASWRAAGFLQVTVTGHSDSSGSPAGNLRVSRERAAAVGAYLRAGGLPAAAIRVKAGGEAEPIVPTEDGVRESQNRRVEVRLER